MKKKIAAILGMSALLLFTGCGAGKENTVSNDDTVKDGVIREEVVGTADTDEAGNTETAGQTGNKENAGETMDAGNANNAGETTDAENADNAGGAAGADETAAGEPADTNAVKSVVVYFSATGNTKVIAEYIADLENADIMEIEPENPYSSEDLNYNDSSCRANQEMNDDSARPAIKNDMSAVLDYDVIYLGYPIWWGVEPRIIQTFLDTYDLSGKTVYAFCTSGSSNVDRSVSDINDNYPGVVIADSRRFDSEDGKDVVENWLDELKK